MSDRVIVVGTKRAGNRISSVELMQMAGRAGRSDCASVGYVDIIVESSEMDTIDKRLNDENNFVISSVLNYNRIEFHLMGEISSERVRNIRQADDWYKSSFSFFCENKIKIGKVIDKLKELGCVSVFGTILRPTRLGSIASKYYFHPEDITGWKDNFETISNKDLLNNDLAIAWALSNVSGQHIDAYLGKNQYLLDEYIDQTSSLGLGCGGECEISGLMWWSVLGGPSVGALSSYKKMAKFDFERLCNALVEVEQTTSWGMKSFFNNLKLQVRYGIPSYLIPLCRLKGIGKSYAYELYNIGIENEEQLRNRYSEIEFLENDGLWSVVGRLVNG